MSKRLTTYRGKTLRELQELSLDEVVEFFPARQRRSLTRPDYWNHERKKLLNKLKKAKQAMDQGRQIVVKTHIRDFVILPEFVGLTVEVYNGQAFSPIEVTFDKIGNYFGEFSHARKVVKHSAPGIGATRSSMFVPLK